MVGRSNIIRHPQAWGGGFCPEGGGEVIFFLFHSFLLRVQSRTVWRIIISDVSLLLFPVVIAAVCYVCIFGTIIVTVISVIVVVIDAIVIYENHFA